MSTLASVIIEGLYSAMPSPSIVGRLYFTTDTAQIYYDTGSAWDNVTPQSAAIITAIQQQSYVYAVDSGTANALAVSLTPTPTIVDGSLVVVKVANTNTGASTIAVNGGSAKAITKGGTTALTGGEMAAGQIVFLVYDGTEYQLIGGTGSGGGVSQIIAGTNVTISPIGGTGNVTINASGGGGSTITLKQYTYVAGSASSSSTQTSPAITISAGDFVVIFAQFGTSPTSATFSDSLGNTWTKVAGQFGCGADSFCSQAAYSTITNGGSATFTVTVNTATPYLGMVVLDYPSSVGSVNQSASNVDGSNTAFQQGPSITTTQRTLNIFCVKPNFANSGYFGANIGGVPATQIAADGLTIPSDTTGIAVFQTVNSAAQTDMSAVANPGQAIAYTSALIAVDY